MTGDYPRPAADHYLVDVATDQHVPMTVGHRHRVVVGPVPDQRQGAYPGRMLVAGIVGGWRKGKQGRQVPLQSLSYRLVMTSQPGIEPLAALYLQVGVQVLEALERGDWYQEVPASIPHQTFHLPFIISLARTAKPVIEQVVDCNSENILVR